MNLIKLATFINVTMCDWIRDNPNNKSQYDCEQAVMKATMKYTRGQCSPDMIRYMISYHREPMITAGFMMQC